MATRGYRPVCAIYSTFLQRAFDPIVHDVALQKLPVVFCMDRAGLSGDDGPTHHGLFDISYLRGIPEMTLMAPKDEDELADMMKTALTLPGPSALRYPRGAVAGVTRKAQPQVLEIGKAEVISDGNDVALLGLGPMAALARELGSRLEREGYSAAVINPRFVKPLDRELLAHYAGRVAAIVTFEDHVKMGGFGTAVVEALEEMGLAIPVVRIGWPDQFIEHGKVDALRAKYGLTVEAAYAQVLPLIAHRQRRTLVAS
jgi:1-deoxy-D-xylulose-5-phosphate synthase